MAQVCAICGKRSLNGNRISHAHNVSKRQWKPNLHVVHAVVAGQTKRIKVCTRCMRSGKVLKASR
jgi:large subunit ribosomal protein L28